MEIENKYASKGVAGAGLGLGIAGTALGLLQGNGLGGILGGWGGNCNNNCGCSENMLVNRYELDMKQELAAKDAKIGLLESNIYTDSKITDTYAVLNGQINALAAEVRANKDAQTAVNMNQAVYNGTNTAALTCLQSQVAQLYGLTKLVVPNTSVCPGWGNVTITPAAAPAAGA
jgi:hypothetical protein